MARERTLRRGVIGALVLCMSLLLMVRNASAYQLTKHAFSTSFDGTGTTVGPFGPEINDIAVDQATGSVYVATRQNGGVVVDKFNSAGLPEAFSDPSLSGASSLFETASFVESEHVTVDNSTGPAAGRIYLSNSSIPARIWAYEPSGAPVGGKFPMAISATAT